MNRLKLLLIFFAFNSPLSQAQECFLTSSSAQPKMFKELKENGLEPCDLKVWAMGKREVGREWPDIKDWLYQPSKIDNNSFKICGNKNSTPEKSLYILNKDKLLELKFVKKLDEKILDYDDYRSHMEVLVNNRKEYISFLKKTGTKYNHSKLSKKNFNTEETREYRLNLLKQSFYLDLQPIEYEIEGNKSNYTFLGEPTLIFSSKKNLNGIGWWGAFDMKESPSERTLSETELTKFHTKINLEDIKSKNNINDNCYLNKFGDLRVFRCGIKREDDSDFYTSNYHFFSKNLDEKYDVLFDSDHTPQLYYYFTYKGLEYYFYQPTDSVKDRFILGFVYQGKFYRVNIDEKCKYFDYVPGF